ncbi:hypothetical protein ACFC0C_16035 [Streptomyces sp. NPDC056178]|uniref:hypothetical protein n=1 Tax=unclassified Streptomyces TaxID=2593676 RepID=UPI0035DD4D38
MSILVPVAGDGLLLADMTGRGDLVLPVGPVEDGETPEQAAQQVLPGTPGSLPIVRLVAVDEVQMRRRKIITHIMVTGPITREDTAFLSYRDPRAVLRALPTVRAIADLPEGARTRALIGLQALAIGAVAHLESGTVQRLELVASHEHSSAGPESFALTLQSKPDREEAPTP